MTLVRRWCLLDVAGMIVPSVQICHMLEILNSYPLQTRDIKAILTRFRAPLVVGVNTTHGTKEMFRRVGIEGVGPQFFMPPDDLQIGYGYRGNNSVAPAAD